MSPVLRTSERSGSDVPKGPPRHRHRQPGDASSLGRIAWSAVLAGLLAVPAGRATEEDPRRDTVVRVVEQVMPSVVNIATEEIVEYRDPFADLYRDYWGPYYRNRPRATRYSLGSGVIIDEEGYVLTNLHVVQRATKVWVQLADGRELEARPIVGTSRSDVALLRLVAPEGERFRALSFARNEDLLLGETVLALGNPFGLGGSVSRGILSSKNRRPAVGSEPLEIQDWLQTDAAINPGSSGGPLVNLRGELIGLNVAVHREGQGIGFAIPVQQVTEALGKIFTPEVQVARWFGARVQPGAAGLRIVTVQPGSPAQAAGLEVGDVVTRVQGTEPRSFVHCMLLLSGEEKELALTVRRGGKSRNLTVKPQPLGDVVELRLGLTLQEMDAAVAQQFGLRPGQGLLVAEVKAGGPAARAQLEPGHVIAAIGDQATPDLLTAAEALAESQPGDKVTLTLLVEQRRGYFTRLRQATTEVTLR